MGLCLAMSLLTASRTLSAGPNETRYTDREHGFSLVPPPKWATDLNLIPHYAVFIEPTQSGTSTGNTRTNKETAATISTYGGPAENLTQDQYVEATRKEVAKDVGMTIYDEKKLTLDGMNAHSWRMHIRIPGQSPSENRQVFCVRNNQVTILTLTVTPQKARTYDDAFDKMLASFRWLKNSAKANGTSTAKTDKNSNTTANTSANTVGSKK